MQVQVNVIFDLENELERSTLINRITRMLDAAGVIATVVPAGNGADAGPVDDLPQTTQVSGLAKPPSPGRVAAAANARAAKQAQQKPTSDASLNQLASAADLAGGTNGQDQSDDDDALGLSAPSMSPGEAKDAALAIVREAYSAGHVAQVKALQKELGVAKFYDVDVAGGHAFYQRVMKLAHEVGIRR
jgi:hypothetical protein